MIRVVAHVRALPGKKEQLERVLVALLAPTRSEEGCVFYDLHQGDDPRCYTFIEEWKTAADLERHLASPHIRDAPIDGLIAAPPDIQRYSRVAGTE